MLKRNIFIWILLLFPNTGVSENEHIMNNLYVLYSLANAQYADLSKPISRFNINQFKWNKLSVNQKTLKAKITKINGYSINYLTNTKTIVYAVYDGSTRIKIYNPNKIILTVINITSQDRSIVNLLVSESKSVASNEINIVNLILHGLIFADNFGNVNCEYTSSLNSNVICFHRKNHDMLVKYNNINVGISSDYSFRITDTEWNDLIFNS